MGFRQTGPEQMGPRAQLSAPQKVNSWAQDPITKFCQQPVVVYGLLAIWAPGNLGTRQFGPRHSSPEQLGPGQLGPERWALAGQLGPGQSDPGPFGPGAFRLPKKVDRDSGQ